MEASPTLRCLILHQFVGRDHSFLSIEAVVVASSKFEGVVPGPQICDHTSNLKVSLNRHNIHTILRMSRELLSRANLSIMGPPGSGKGSYGRLLAEFLAIPLISVSTLLKHAQIDTTSGKLADDETVSKIIVNHIPRNQPYMLDGFPRTLNQVRIMEQDWSIAPVHAIISLEVPRQVCFEKMLGRRICTICDRNWNVANVQFMSFNLPPSLPDNCFQCSHQTRPWRQRADDFPDIINERLDTFYNTSEPIIRHFEAKRKLLRFTPNMGFLDVPRFQSTVADWLVGLHCEMER